MTRPFAVRRAALTVQGKDPGTGDVLRTKRGANFDELDQAVGAAITAYAYAVGLDPDDPDDGQVNDVIDALSEIDSGQEDKGLLQSVLDGLVAAAENAAPVVQAVQRAQEVLSRYSGHTGYGQPGEPFGRRDRGYGDDSASRLAGLETKAGKEKPGSGQALLLLQQANSDLNDALDAVGNAVTSVKDAIASLRRVEGSGVLPGNLQAYLLPWLQTMIDGDRGGGIYLEAAIERVEELVEEYEDMDEEGEDVETDADGHGV